MNKKIIFFFGMILLGFSFVSSASLRVNDPTTCPSSNDALFPGVSCAPEDICGDISGTPFCLNTAGISVPSPTTTTSNPGLPLSGFGVDCYNVGSSCANNILCQRDSTCYNVNRLTQCTNWGVAQCDVCISGYTYCDGSYIDGNGCEINIGTTAYPGESNAVYNSVCGPQCSSGYLDCNINLGSSVDGCEIQTGVTPFGTTNAVYSTCTTAICSSGWMACESETATVDGCNYQIGGSCTTGESKPGTWSNGCICTELAQEHFITNTLARGWGNYLLSGEQWNPNGWLMNLTHINGGSIGIDNESCIVFSDGSKQCNGSYVSGGEINLSDYMLKTGDNATGRYTFDGDWLSGGVTIDAGDIFAQRLYVFNITSLAITHLNVNGSLIPNEFNNTFDIGSTENMWRRGYFGEDIYIGGESINDKFNSVNLSGGNNEILMVNGIGGTKTNQNFKYDGTTNTLEITDSVNPSKLSPGLLSFSLDKITITGSSGFTPQLGNFAQSSFYTEYNPSNFISINPIASDVIDRSILDIFLVDNNDLNHLYFNTYGVYLSGYDFTNWNDDYLITKGYADLNYGASTSYSFSNGLNEIGGNVGLGGTLNQDTTITGNNYLTLESSNGNESGAIYFSPGNLYLEVYGNTDSTDIDMYENAIFIQSSGNEIVLRGNQPMEFTSNSGFEITAQGDALTNGVMYYNSNYSSSFVNRSLVDKEYVDTQIIANAPQDVGWTLSGSTIINNGYDINNQNSGGNFLWFGGNSFQWGDSTYYGTGFSVTSGNIKFRNIYDGIDITPGGIVKYSIDLSGSYDNRSLVDKEYVDNAILSGGDTSNLVPYTGATQDVNLGSRLINAGNFYTGSTSLSTYIGKSTSPSDNFTGVTAVGYFAANNNNASSVTAIGAVSGLNNQGVSLTALGTSSGSENTGDNLIAIGNSAGMFNTGSNSTGIGYESLESNSGNNVIAIGYGAGQNNVQSNKFIIQQSNVNAVPLIYGDFATGQVNATDFCTVGGNCLSNISGGGDTSNLVPYTGAIQDVDLGARKIISNNFYTSEDNLSVYIGDGVSPSTDFNGVTSVGYLAAFNNFGSAVTTIGTAAGMNSQGVGLSALGSNAASQNIGDEIVAIGHNAGQFNSGNYSIFVGKSSGYNNSQNNAVILGYEAGYNNKGFGVTAVGYQSANLNENSFLTAIGAQAGAENLGERVDVFGVSAGAANSGNFVVSIGANSGVWNEGNNSVFIGSLSGQSNTGTDNTFIGAFSGSSSNGNYNIGIGSYSFGGVTGNYNIGIGYGASSLNSGNNTIGIGLDSLMYNAGNNVIAFGTRAGFQNIGNDTIFIGSDVGSNNFISGRLMIDVENTTAPLIDGDFVANNLTINGNLIVTQNINVSGCIRYNGGTLGVCI
jgi:hypothetical protein